MSTATLFRADIQQDEAVNPTATVETERRQTPATALIALVKAHAEAHEAGLIPEGAMGVNVTSGDGTLAYAAFGRDAETAIAEAKTMHNKARLARARLTSGR